MPKPRKMKEAKAVETEPDAWERFEKAVDTIAPPKPQKPTKDRGKSPAKRGPVEKPDQS